MTHSNRDGGERYCLLRQGALHFAVPATQVREVLPAPRLTIVPGADSVLAGLFHHRNEFLAVLRPHILTDKSDINSRTQPMQMIVIERSEGGWGLLVDEVVGLSALEVCVHSDAGQAEADVDALWGTATHQDRVVHVVDPKKLYRTAESELQHQWTASLAASATRGRQATTRMMNISPKSNTRI